MDVVRDLGSTLVVTESQLARVRAFIGQKCVLGRSLVVPMRVLYKAYAKWAFPAKVTAQELRCVLEVSPWAEVIERDGRGRLKVAVNGVGLLPDDGS